MYTERNFKTAKALKEAFKAGEEIYCFEPGIDKGRRAGKAYLEGPHGVHKWYKAVILDENRRVVKILS